jgi:hypothetical protein
MRRFTLLGLLVAACCSSGCLVLTLQPLYDQASLVVDAGLTGTWQAREQPATVVFEAGEWKSYRVTYTARSTTYSFVAYLTTIGDATFVDVTPLHGVEEVPLLIPVHGFARLRRDGDTLTIAAPDYDWFTAAMRGKRLGHLAAALDARQNAIVTSRTDEVRGWVLAQAKIPEAFREPIEFTRTRPFDFPPASLPSARSARSGQAGAR